METQPDAETSAQQSVPITHEQSTETQKTDPFDFDGLWDQVDDIEFPTGVGIPPHIAFHGLTDSGFIPPGLVGTLFHPEQGRSNASVHSRSFRATSPRPPPAFVEVIDTDSSDSEESDTEQPAPKEDKGKEKEHVDEQLEERSAAANVTSAPSVHGSAEPPAAEASVKPDINAFSPSPLPRHEEIPVQDPPVPQSHSDVHPDPEIPTTGPLPSEPATNSPPNILSDLTKLLQGLTEAFATHPELTEGVRNVIRNVVNGTYLTTQRDSTLQAADQVLNQARVVSEDATNSVSNALQGVFDALNTGLQTSASQLENAAAQHQASIGAVFGQQWPLYNQANPAAPPPPPPPAVTQVPGPQPSQVPPPPGPPPRRSRGSRGGRSHYPTGVSANSTPYGIPGPFGYLAFSPEPLHRRGTHSPGRSGYWSQAPLPPLNSFSPPQGPPPGNYPYQFAPPPGPPPFDSGNNGIVAGRPAFSQQEKHQGSPYSSIDARKEESIRQLNERKTQLEIAKEAYKAEKAKWKEAKEARRRERDEQIQKL